MVRKLLALVFLALPLAACSLDKSPTAPSVAPTVSVIAYDINLPYVLGGVEENWRYPNGVEMPPAQAQSSWDYRDAFGGAPNVYYGPIAPPAGMYQGVGIVVAPTAVSDVETFTHADWPVCPATCKWVGRFVYAMQASR